MFALDGGSPPNGCVVERTFVWPLGIRRPGPPTMATARSFIGGALASRPPLDLVHGHHFRTFPGSESQRHPATCICHWRPIDRSSNGYTNAYRKGLIAAMYALPNRPFGFTSTAICAW